MLSLAGRAIGSADDGLCPVGNKCFKLVDGYFGNVRRTWVEALEICRSGPGYLPDLASVTSEADNGKQSHPSVRETTLINVYIVVESHVAIVDGNSGEYKMKWSRECC